MLVCRTCSASRKIVLATCIHQPGPVLLLWPFVVVVAKSGGGEGSSCGYWVGSTPAFADRGGDSWGACLFFFMYLN